MKTKFLFFTMAIITTSAIAQPPSFKFTPDTGLRIDNVAIADATLINDTLFLFYNYHLNNGTPAKGVGFATSNSDWLTFDTSANYFDYSDYFITYRMPDSTYRKYFPENFNMNGKTIKSKSSVTMHNFVMDTGIRYTLHYTDSVLGVSSYIAASDGSVHMFYNTTGQSNIACRHAIAPSGNNGMSFNYASSNVFGDSLYGNGKYYVDPNSILNNDGSITVYLMNQNGGPYPPAGRTGYICSFTSYDNGQTFSLDNDGGDTVRFKFDDFDNVYGIQETVYSLNDPKAVKLPDGRYRIYVSAMLKDSTENIRYAIVSATSQLTQNLNIKPAETKIILFPNPSGGIFTVVHPSDITRLIIFNTEMKRIYLNTNVTSGHTLIDISDKPKGLYFVTVISANGNRNIRKLVIR